MGGADIYQPRGGRQGACRKGLVCSARLCVPKSHLLPHPPRVFEPLCAQCTGVRNKTKRNETKPSPAQVFGGVVDEAGVLGGRKNAGTERRHQVHHAVWHVGAAGNTLCAVEKRRWQPRLWYAWHAWHALVISCYMYLAVLDDRIGSWLAGMSTASSGACSCSCSWLRVRFVAMVVGGTRGRGSTGLLGRAVRVLPRPLLPYSLSRDF
jgi:hypothetical protein